MKFLGATFILWIVLRNELKTYTGFAVKTNASGNIVDQTFGNSSGSTSLIGTAAGLANSIEPLSVAKNLYGSVTKLFGF